MTARRHRFQAGLLLGSVLALVSVAPASAATGWTGPRTIGPWQGCTGVAAAIDGTGGFHVVAACGEAIRYSWKAGDRWSSREFAHPPDRFDQDPQIAIDGKRVYVAFSREDRSTCGSSYFGVYYRWRDLPDGRWSAATRLGKPGDNLHSFRAAHGHLHATVGNGEATWYESDATGTLARYRLPGSSNGSSSLRLSNDGTARIVYQDGQRLRFAIFNGSGFDTTSIPGTNSFDRGPMLVLDAQDHAHVVWRHTGGESCGDDGPATVGTYYATNRTGAWTPPSQRRVTGDLGAHSLTVDTRTGRVHLLVAGEFGVKYFTKTATGTWRGQRLASSGSFGGAAIRQDLSTGTLLVVYNGANAAKDAAYLTYLTKP